MTDRAIGVWGACGLVFLTALWKTASRRTVTEPSREPYALPQLDRPVWAVLVAVVCAVQFVVGVAPLQPAVPSDSWLYVAMARQWLDGHWPYRAFFFSHPPLHLLPYVVWQELWPEGALDAGWVPALCALGTALGLGRAAAALGGPLAGWGAAWCWLTAASVLRTANAATGLHEGLLPAAFALAALARGRWLAAALWTAACVATSTLVGALAGMALLAGLWAGVQHQQLSHKQAVQALLAAAAALAGVFAAVYAWSDLAWLEQVYLSPLRRPSERAGLERVQWLLAPFAQSHVLALVGAAVAVWRRQIRPDQPGLLATLAALAGALAVLLGFGSVHSYYVVIVAAPLAVLAGLGLQSAVALLPDRKGQWLLGVLAGAALWNLHGVRPLLTADVALAEATAQPREALCAQLARDLPAKARVMGDSNLAPLLSLCTDRPLWHQLADTNTKRYRAEPDSLTALLGELAADPPELVALLDQHGLAMEPRFVQWLQANCGLVAQVAWSGRDRVVLLTCRKRTQSTPQ